MNDVDFAEEIERQNQHHYDTTGTVVVEEEQVEKPDNPYANKDIVRLNYSSSYTS